MRIFVSLVCGFVCRGSNSEFSKNSKITGPFSVKVVPFDDYLNSNMYIQKKKIIKKQIETSILSYSWSLGQYLVYYTDGMVIVGGLNLDIPNDMIYV